MSRFWSLYIIVITVAYVAGSAWLLLWAKSRRVPTRADEQTTGHSFDGIQEYDLPLPRWWLWLFVGTIAFTGVYLVLYPGFGSFQGVLGWSQHGQHAAEVADADARYGPIYAAYAARPIAEIAGDDKAVKMGGRLFANNCATCHGADARGGRGYPNLTDAEWIYGGAPDQIKTTIMAGRLGFMPPFAPALGGDQGVADVVAYVRSLSGQKVDEASAAAGKPKFDAICAACHGKEGKGNPAMGAVNLTDDVWLFGGTAADIEETLRKGRMSKMPAHADILGDQKAHLVATYIYKLSRVPQAQEQ